MINSYSYQWINKGRTADKQVGIHLCNTRNLEATA